MKRLLPGAALLVLVGCAAGLHLAGLESLLPHHNEPDAYIVYQSNEPDGPVRGTYPYLLVALARAVDGPPAGRLESSTSRWQHMRQASAPFVATRRLLACLSLLVVPGTWLLARRWLSDGQALLAACWLTTSLQLLCYTGQARPHGVVTALCLLAVLAALSMAERGRWIDHLATGAAVGLAVACFPSGGLALLPWLVAGGLRLRLDGPRALLPLATSALLVAGLVSWSYLPAEERAEARSAGVLAAGPAPARLQASPPQAAPARPRTTGADPMTPRGHPGRTGPGQARPGRAPGVAAATGTGAQDALPGPRSSGQDDPPPGATAATRAADAPPANRRVLKLWRHSVYLDLFNGKGFLAFFRGLISHDPLLLALAALGGAVLLIRARSGRRSPHTASGRDLLVVGSFVAPALVVPGLYEPSMQRYFLPLLPFLAVLAACGTTFLCAGLGRRTPLRRSVGALIALVILGLPTATALRFVQLRRAPDTLSLAARWIEDRPDLQAARVFLGNLSLPLFARRPRLLDDSPWAGSAWERYQRQQRPAATLVGGRDLRPLTVEETRAALASGRTAAAVQGLLTAHAPELAVITHGGTAQEVESPMQLEQGIRMAVQRAGGRLVHAISPYPHGGPGHPGMAYFLGDSAVVDVWRATALGPPIEIYRFP